MIRRLLAFTLLFLLAGIPVALATDSGYGNDPCDEYHETRHPECQTTTTYQVTTTQPEVTTTTPNETTTTQTVETTTTTAAPCAPGLIHQPPLCVDPSTTTIAETTTTATPIGPIPMDPPTDEVLPFTGLSSSVLALVSSLSLAGGLVLLAVRRKVGG